MLLSRVVYFMIFFSLLLVEFRVSAIATAVKEGMAADQKVHTFEEVVKHNTTKDCWLIIRGKRNDFEDVGHSDSAREERAKFHIGEIDPTTVPLKRAYIPLQQAHYNHDKTPEFVIRILQFLVPLLILGWALAVRRYTKEK